MSNYDNIPIVCIVGRPNVGKSSLFNCIVGYRRAVVLGDSGTTRDRLEEIFEINEKKIKLVDTGGYLLRDKDHFSPEVKKQIKNAMQEASLLLFVTDAAGGITSADREVALMLRKFNKPVMLVSNKVDNSKLKANALEFFQLGYGQPLMVSCIHNKGIKALKNDILTEIEKHLGELDVSNEHGHDHIKVAIVGRPNVGKSSFINCLIKRDRVIVSDVPGTTRDSIDTNLVFNGDEYVLIDTAGIRHKRKIKDPVDVYSIMRSKESIQRCDVVVLLLDATEGITKDDVSILNFVIEYGKACLVVVNKWDLARETEDVTKEEYRKHLLYASSQLETFPLHFISALSGEKVVKTLDKVKELNNKLDEKISTPMLNRVFEKNNPSFVPIPRRKKRPNFLYVIQSSCRPVEFSYFVNDPALVLSAHVSFIKNQLRENFSLTGIPVKIIFKKSKKGKK